MSKDDKNQSWCINDTPKADQPRVRRLSSDFGHLLTRKSNYDANQSKLRAAASSEALSCDSASHHLSGGSLISLSNGEHHSGRVARWAVSIDAVLSDMLGKMAFSYFLKLEFSEENLQFWIDCENYHNCSRVDRARMADSIIRKYIGEDAEMSVNLPSQLLEEALKSRARFSKEKVAPNFNLQQRHIYDLMKFDSYPRFIRSEHYRKLVQMNITQKTVTEADISRAFEKRPNHGSLDQKKRAKKSAFQILRNAVHIPTSVRKERRLSSEGLLLLQNRLTTSPTVHEPKCFVHFSDGKNIVVRLHINMTVFELLSDLAQRFQITMNNVDWMLVGEKRETPMIMSENCLVLKDKHIRAEVRVTFRLDIVHINRRIAIRAKTHKPIYDVLRPIVEKYAPELDMSQISVRVDYSSSSVARKGQQVNLSEPVLTMDNERLIMDVHGRDNIDQLVTKKSSTFLSSKEDRNPLRTVKKAKKRRESFGPLKRLRTKPKMHMMDISNTSKENDVHLRYPLMRADTHIPNVSTKDESAKFSGRIDTQRGLLNKATLELPKFLSFEKKDDADDGFHQTRLRSCSASSGNEPDYDGMFEGKIPSATAAYALFGSSTKGFPNSSYNDGESGHMSGLNNLFDGFAQSIPESHFPGTYDGLDSSVENLDFPGSYESLTDWEESSTSNKLYNYHELDTTENILLPKFTKHLLSKFTKSHSSPAALRTDIKYI